MSENSHARPGSTWVVPGATFVVGLGLGAAVVGFAEGGHSTSGEQHASSPAISASSSEGSTVITVPQACQRASANLNRGTGLLRGGVTGLRTFQPQQIVDLLDELEKLDNQTRPLLHKCSEADLTPSPSPGPTAYGAGGSPTAGATTGPPTGSAS